MTDNEIEFYYERTGMMMNDGIDVFEAEKKALEMVLDSREGEK